MDLTPHAWHLWLLVGLAASAAELHFGNFVLLWFGLGAGVSAVAAALGLPVEVQLLAFVLTAAGLFAASRTIFRRLIAPKAERMQHGEAALVGVEGQVVEALDDRSGAVRIHGELWSARSLEGVIAVGEPVRVERVDGLKLYVRRAQAPLWAALPTKDQNP